MNIKKTKVLFIHHSAGWGGAPINMINIIKNINHDLFDVHVLLLKDSIVKDKLKEHNIAFTVCDSYFYRKWYVYFSLTDAGLISAYQFFTLFKVFISWVLSKYVFAPKVLNKFTFDIVHLNSSVLSDWLKPAGRKGKVIYHIQEPISKGWFGIRYRFLRSEVAKYADKIIAISKDNAIRINLPKKTEVVYNFAEIPLLKNESVPIKSVLYVGGSSKIKGIEVLIEAIPFIKNDIHVFLAGQYPNLKKLSIIKKVVYQILYPEAYKLRNNLVRINLYNNVSFIGIVDAIDAHLQQVSLLVSPFTVPHFSRPIIEAFANGKPVIASDVKGMEEIVNHGINGILIKNGDGVALANSINLLANDTEMLCKMGVNGRQKAIELFAPQFNVRKIESIYFELKGK